MIAPKLESDRLILVPLTLKHLSNEYVAWMNDFEVIKFLESGGNYTLEILRSFLLEQEEKKIYFWAIHIKESNKHIGNIKIDPINYQTKSGEYGIMMGDKKMWGKGFAKEASKLVIEYCFKNLNISKITLGVININTTAIQLYKKLGFTVYETVENNGYENKTLRMYLKKNKLILGTVQLGLDYGINNTQGKPSLKKVFEILNTAYDNGIEILDTAEVYGNAQEIIGLFHKRNPNKKFQIITKLNSNASFENKNIIDFIKEDCKILNVSKLRGYMFHNYESLKTNKNQLKLLLKAKQDGLVKKIGTSLYTNEELEDVIENYKDIDLIQIPFNLLDNSTKRESLLKKAKGNNIEIHTRSVFLQGLFFKKESTLPKLLTPLVPYLRKIKNIKKEINLKTEELTLQYPLSKPYIDFVLVGVDNIEQLLSNITVSQLKANINFDEIDSINVVEDNLLNPVNW